MAIRWDPWRGCTRISEGCKYCYIHRGDLKRGIDTSNIIKTDKFDLPIRKDKNGQYLVKKDTLMWTCFSTDFFHEKADLWRIDAWKYIKERSDLFFFFITKRIDRFNISLPDDWNDGYDNVGISCTVENQDRVDYRLPIFCSLPIKHKTIVLQPLLERVNIEKYLTDEIEEVVVGGESGKDARVCEYDWILDLRNQCVNKNINFSFRETGSHLLKEGKLYNINPMLQHKQARLANIDFKKI